MGGISLTGGVLSPRPIREENRILVLGGGGTQSRICAIVQLSKK